MSKRVRFAIGMYEDDLPQELKLFPLGWAHLRKNQKIVWYTNLFDSWEIYRSSMWKFVEDYCYGV